MDSNHDKVILSHFGFKTPSPSARSFVAGVGGSATDEVNDSGTSALKRSASRPKRTQRTECPAFCAFKMIYELIGDF